jgi:hypothetical protein
MADIMQGAVGSVIVPEYTERRMTFYAVTSREMRDLSFFNTAAIVAFSIASFLLSLAFSLMQGGVFASGEISPEGRVLTGYAAPLSFVMALIFYAVGGLVLRLRGQSIEDVRKESKQVTATVRISAQTETAS